MTSPRAWIAAAALGVVLAASAMAAWAFWSAPGPGTDTAGTATFDPAAITVPGSATNFVTVSWTQQASLQPASAGNSAITYAVQRQLGSAAWAAASGAGCAGAQPHGVTSCVDEPPAAGSYNYRVVADLHGWAATSSAAGPVVVSGDNVVPAVESIDRLDGSSTNAGTVRWTVFFSESVTGVGAGDFVLARAGGLSGGSIVSVTGSGNVYTVTASSGTGDGTLGLNLVDDDSIVDAAAHKLGGTGTGNGDFTGQTYGIDHTAPVASSIVRADSSPTNATTVHWTVTLSEPVTGVSTGDFELAATGVSGAEIESVTGSGSSYTVTSSAESGDGTLRLDLVDEDSITDAAGNPLGGTGDGNGDLTGQTYGIDLVAPTVTSIARADASPTSAGTLHWTVTFSESVTGVGAGDFTLAGSGVAGAAIGSVTGSGSSYTVTSSSGSGDGTVGLDLVDDDSIVDAVTNALGGTGAGNGDLSGQSYGLDHTAPAVSSIVRQDASPTSAATVKWTVAFSEPVSGVDASDFALARTGGLTGGSITSVTGSGSSYTVTSSSGSGDGALGLDLVDDDSILDAAANKLGGTGTGNGDLSGQAYGIDHSVPVVSSIVRADASPTNAATVHWTVTFSETVTGVDASDFALARTGGLTGGSITSVTGSGSSYAVTSSSGSGDGTLKLDLVDDDSITDGANALGGTGAGNGDFSGQAYGLDRTAPVVSSIVRADASPTNASTLHWTVTFSESVTGVGSGDFALAASGVSGAAITSVSGSGSSYTVTSSSGSGDGALGLDLVDDDSILDAATNKLGGTGTGNGDLSGQAYNLDRTAPTVSSIVRVDASPTNAATVHWTVTFSEAVTGVDAGDFTLAHTGVSGAAITSVTGSASSYTVTSSSGSGDGTLGLDVVDDDSIVDAASNKVGGTGTGNGDLSGQAYSLDRTAPTVSSIVRVDASPTNASTVHWTVTFSESVTGVGSGDFTLAHTGVGGAAITAVTGSASSYTVTSSTGIGDGTLGLDLVDDDSIVDPAANKLGGTGTGNGNLAGQAYSLDHTPPVVSSIVRLDASPTNAATLHWTATFSESVTGVDAGDFALSRTGGLTGGSIASVTGSGTTYVVTSSSGTGDGTLGLDLVDDDSIADAATNKLGGTGTGNGDLSGQAYSLDHTAPVVSSIVRADASPTNASTAHWTVTFSESVTGVGSGDFALAATGVSGAAITSVTGSGSSYTVTSSSGSGDGTLELDLVDDDSIADAATNKLGGTGTGNGNLSGQAYTLDHTAPVVSSIVRADASPTNASTVHWTVTFSESVTGVGTGDFALAAAGVGGAAITAVTGSGSSYTVTSSTGIGDGTLGLDLVDDDSIVDPAANKLGGTGTGNGNLSGQAYGLDHTPPVVSSIVRVDASPTSAATVHWTVTFSESVTGVDAGDFALSRTGGLTGGSIASVTGSGTTYAVTSSSGTGDGTLGVDLVDDDSIVDAASNRLGGTGTANGNLSGQAYTLDHTAPVVSSIVRADSSPTNAATAHWTVTFSESVTGVDASDFALARTGALSGGSIASVTGSGSSYTVTSSTGSGDGTLELDLVDDDSIVDAASNRLGGTGTANGNLSGQAYTLDHTAPVVSSIVRADASPTNASTVHWTVTFSESVTGVDASDFALARTGGLTGGSITSVTGSGTSYTVTSSSGSGDGTLELDLVDDDSIVDAAANKLGGTGTGNGNLSGQAYSLDRTAPVVSSIVRADASPTNAATVHWTVTFSESVTGVDASDFALAATGVSGAAITSVTGSGGSYTVSSSGGSGDGTLGLNLVDDDSIVDPAANKLGGTGTGNGNLSGQSYSLDHTAPVVSSIVRVDVSPTNAATVHWTVTFSETVTGVDASDFALARTGALSGGSIASVTGSGSSYAVTSSSGSGDGTLGLNLVDDDSIADAVTNKLGGTGAGNGNLTGQSYSVDHTAPTASSIVTADATPTTAATVSWTVTFSESVSGVDAGDFALARTGTVSASAAIQSVSGSGSTRTVTATTVSGEGTLGLNLVADGTIVDAVGNALAAGVTGQTYTVDRTAPTSTGPQMFDTNANGKIDQVKVVFDETLASSTATAPWTLANVPSGGTLASVSTSGATATLTLNEGAGAADTAVGTFTVALAANAAGIRDAAGNQSSFAATAPSDHAAPVRGAMSMLDVNANGKVDEVTVGFSEVVASPITATAFTLAGAPSGGTLGVATPATSVVTLAITEGAGAASTAVGSFTVALAAASTGVRDSAGNQASFAATAPADKAGPVPVTVTDTNGLTDGKIETGDTFVATFSEAIAPASMPSSTPITEDAVGGGAVTFAIAGITNGAHSLGTANYVTGAVAVVFAGASVLSAGNTTITITVGACSASCGAEKAGTGMTLIFAPATTLLDAAGNAAAGSTPAAFRVF